MANPKKIIKAVKSAKKAAERAKTNAIQKNSVKVKPAAKPKRNPSDPAKTAYKFNNSYSRAEKRSIYKTGGGN
jgi:hypothetical protein